MSRPTGRVGRLALSLLIAAVLAPSVAAQSLTDLGVHPPPTDGPYPYSLPGNWLPGTTGFPAQGTTYSDPVFGQTIRRVTNVYPRVGDSTLYNKNGNWNADGTLILHDPNASGVHDIIDTTTGAVVRAHIPWGGEPTFDPNVRDVFYYASGTTLRKFLVPTGASALVKDFGATIGNLGGSVDCVDVSGRYFVLNVNGITQVWDAIDASGRLPGDPAYVPQAAGLGLALPGDAGHGGVFSGSFVATFGPGYIGITPRADGVFMVGSRDSTTGNTYVFWYALDLGAKTMSTPGVNRTPNWNGGDHGDVVSASDGNSYFIGINSGSPGWAVMRWNLTQGGPSTLLVRVGNNNHDEHFSGIPRGIWRDWMVVDLETNASDNSDLGLWEPFHQEIFMVNVLTAAVRRLAHHRSQRATQEYTWEPRVSVNWDGTRVAFLSNYGYLENQYSDLWTVEIGDGTTPLPSVGSLTPAIVAAGTGGFVLNVNGSNFVSSSVVRWNGANRPTTVLRTTLLQATILATDILTPGTAQVTVFSPAPDGGTSTALPLTIAVAVPLTIVRAGSGSGTVSSVPPGITCGATCSASFIGGTPVVLTAAPGANSRFTGWSGGGCSGTGSCTVTLTTATTVTATFAPVPVVLTIVPAGTGSGTATSSPAGIDCGATCSASFASGTPVTLTASAAAGSTFTGWSGGGCSGTGTCAITLTAATTVTASFANIAAQVPLAVALRGSASGTVTSDPSGISCGTSCSTLYPSGTSVTLTASPAPGASFTGWSGGGCTGTASCVVTLTAAGSVQAIFSAIFTDPNPTAGVSIIRAVDVGELRSAVNTLRVQNFGLAAFAFTDPTLAPGLTPVSAVHVIELRTALGDAYARAGLSPPSQPVITPGVSLIRAADLSELQNAVRALE